MKTLVLVFHPSLNGQSNVNAALAKAAGALDNVTVRDEYALYPDGKIDVKAEQAAVDAADRVVFQFPLYWFSSPALLKQWEDDVLEHGWAYGSEGHAFEGKEFAVAVSTGSPESKYQPEGDNKFTIDEVLVPFQGTANHINATWVKPFVTFGSFGISDEALAKQVEAYKAFLAK
ncbi:NAD(P)H-dependent oxidoreductase [Bifidobacterium avesanii]|uniref:Flavodoxin family protein n=1 Tax=Bifidobacterium avesanii TaxID=1798157 RepID=A0A7K3TF16_9BIFI|nr:NAD(P)H-dependent oxidoreductase [Bifidobacterium avesanii]KAB8295677.1 Flavodoxin-like fold [Bifidobacterium avesanii]NEG77681.1 flavodoxin family protein [Bifidobacterium avesanii]